MFVLKELFQNSNKTCIVLTGGGMQFHNPNSDICFEISFFGSDKVFKLEQCRMLCRLIQMEAFLSKQSHLYRCEDTGLREKN